MTSRSRPTSWPGCSTEWQTGIWGADGSDSFSSHRLWTLDILLPEDVTLSILSAGLVEDRVDIDGLLFEPGAVPAHPSAVDSSRPRQHRAREDLYPGGGGGGPAPGG
ncbi:MAG: hypothetical protein ACLUJG_08460 [Lawsonibacter sp.]